MRLLTSTASGQIVLTQFDSEHIPPYAILSHTWGQEEVDLDDVTGGNGQRKEGWKKLEFCASQASRDGLNHFWIDTCCIDKSNSVEISEAINSMFEWYRRSSRCYVYLSDVTTSIHNTANNARSDVDYAIQTSRWFHRGWTLQELIAPSAVDFYSTEGIRLGDKSSLAEVIHHITHIPLNALRGDKLSDFSIPERMSWMDGRQTTRVEDLAYSLLGLFNISMPIIYGEGEANSRRRLLDQVHMAYKGLDFERFAVNLNPASIPEREQSVLGNQEVQEMHKMLHGHQTRSTVVIRGMGGIGKTQLACEYVVRYSEKYSAIFCIAQQILNSCPSTDLLASIRHGHNVTQVAREVLDWLELSENTQWLLVYDGLENTRKHDNRNGFELQTHQTFPQSDHGSVIITTRSVEIDFGSAIQLSLPNVQIGLQMLSNASGRSCDANDVHAIMLVQELACFPLALSVAGAYIKIVAVSHARYLQLYQDSRKALQQSCPKLSAFDCSAFATWQISFDWIQGQNALAAKLLKSWAYFEYEDIWSRLLSHGSPGSRTWLHSPADHDCNVEFAIRILCDFKLVKPCYTHDQFELAGYAMHRCIHSWTTSILNSSWDDALANWALTCVASEVPMPGLTNWWTLERRLLRHAEKLVNLISDGKLKTTNTQPSLRRLGVLFAHQNYRAQAESLYALALEECDAALGSESTLAFDIMISLGSLYLDQGELKKAEEMFLRALHTMEKAEGAEHTSTLDTISKLDTINKLGTLYSDRGKTEAAEKMYLQALRGYENVLGAEHTTTLDVVNNLGNLYSDQGKMDEAEEMYIRALRGNQSISGSGYASSLSTISNLGNLYKMQGKMQQAEEMYLRALRGKEKVWGPEHVSTLNTVNNLAVLYSDQGKIEAEEMYMRALRGYEKAWGPEHTSTLDAVNNLAILYSDQGKIEKAEELYMRALRGYEKAWGPEHTSTLGAVKNLAIFYSDQGKIEKAEQMMLHALQGYRVSSHPPWLQIKLLEDMLHSLRLDTAPPNLTPQNDQARLSSTVTPRENTSAK